MEEVPEVTDEEKPVEPEVQESSTLLRLLATVIWKMLMKMVKR